METQPQPQLSPPKVQHVTKASSDKILRKFAEIDSDSDSDSDSNLSLPRKSTSKRPRLGKNKKKKKGNDDIEEEEEEEEAKENCDVNVINNMNMNQSGSLLRKVERKSLLPHQINHDNRRSSSGNLLKKFGISKSNHHHHHHHHRGFRHKSVLGAIEKTWSKAIKGASKVFMEKHYNRHRILSSDTI